MNNTKIRKIVIIVLIIKNYSDYYLKKKFPQIKTHTIKVEKIMTLYYNYTIKLMIFIRNYEGTKSIRMVIDGKRVYFLIIPNINL